MVGDAYSVMRAAILSIQQVVCDYHGHRREVCPHVIGTKDRCDKVLTFQFAGGSIRGLPPGGEWRCMFVDDITNAVARKGVWHTGESHTQPQTCVDEVDVEVAY